MIDPLSVENTSPLKTLLNHTAIEKVMHACSEDLDVFKHWLNTIPTPLLDTQILAAFAGFGHGLGFARLVEHITAKVIEKGETRSDWLRRPLAESQLRYAIQDVTCLAPVYCDLAERLTRSGKFTWARAECRDMTDAASYDNNGSDAWLRIRNHDRLDARGQALLAALAAWRESAARLENVPRKHIVTDESLWFIANNKIAQLRSETAAPVPGFSRSQRRKHARSVGMIAAEILAKDESVLPRPRDPNDRRPDPRTLKKLQRAAKLRAAELDLAPELLAPRRLLTGVALASPPTVKHLPMTPWRREAVGVELLAALKSE